MSIPKFILKLQSAGSDNLIHECVKNYNRYPDIHEFMKQILNTDNINIRNSTGNTPLHIACDKDYVSCTKLLLEFGADPNLLSDNTTFPLYAAAQKGHTECVELLLNHGAKIDMVSDENATALYAASSADRTECVKLLLDYGADMEIEFKEQLTSLCSAAYFGNSECVKILLNHNANLNTTHKNKTPLEWAIFNNHTRCAKILKDYQMIYLQNRIKTLEEKVDFLSTIINDHFLYQPDGDGATETAEHYKSFFIPQNEPKI